MWTELADLVFPRQCAGCGAWDTDLCERCSRCVAGPLRRVDHLAPYLCLQERPDGTAGTLFPVYSMGPYVGVRRDAVILWKNSVRAGLNAAMAACVRASCAELGGEMMGAGVAVVPAPSGGTRRRDGRFVAAHIAGAVSSRCEGSRIRDCLTHAGGSNVSRAARASKAAGITVRRAPSERLAIVVDDVLTTGATLAGCARALSECGIAVVGAVVMAHVPDPRGVTGASLGEEM